jgi:hypothetical protein
MTVTAPVLDRITDAVTEWTAAGKMFTAFEVSLAVKQRGVRQRHRQLRDDVHEVIFRVGGSAGYTRTLMDVGAPQQAWVYHRLDDNPYTYQPLDRTGLDAQADIPFVVPAGVRNAGPLATGAARPWAVPVGAYGTDQRGRVCIPVTLVARLGVGPGQRVAVVCDPTTEQVHITRPTANPGDDVDTSYTVEPDGNVRITQGTLLRAGLDGLPCYRIEGSPGLITISKMVW